MLALPADVLALQAGSSYVPHVVVQVGSNTFSSADPLSGLKFVEVVEEAQSYRATIEIQPSNLLAMHPGILQTAGGDEVTIKWGFIDGSQMVTSAPLYVISSSGLSEPGLGKITFSCVGWWELLAASRVVRDPSDAGDAPPVWPKDTTVFSILSELLQGRGNVYLDGDDGNINSYRPYYEADGLEAVLTTVRNLLDMTLCYLKLRDDGFHVVYPSLGDAITWTYSLDGYQFFTRAHAAKISIPNRFVMVPELPTTDTGPEFVGFAVDQDSIDKIGYTDMLTMDEGVTSLGEANQRAHALMQRLKAENSEGTAVVPMNIGQELYDKVRLIDERIGGGISPMEHFVGRIRRVWTTGQYAMEIGLGGLMPHLSSLRTEYPVSPIETPALPITVVPPYTTPVESPPGSMTPVPPPTPPRHTPVPKPPEPPPGPLTPGPMTPIPETPGINPWDLIPPVPLRPYRPVTRLW